VKEHIKLKRRIVRDQQERGYDVTDILYRYENHVSPTFEKYIEPYKDQVDLIIPNNHRYEKALEVLVGFLKNKLKDLA
jgi:uridine kinase